jgi:SAM-dependent methyltransferase
MIELVAQHGANKPPSYLPIYAEFLAPIRNAPVRILEMGIQTGNSLLVWRDYFPWGQVTGIDLELPTMPDMDHIVMYAGAQEDVALLDRVGAERGPFDVIVDDCSHIGALAEASFWPLFTRHLVPGGIYAIEDWGTGYWPNWEDGAAPAPDHTAGMVGFVKRLVDQCGMGLLSIVRLDIAPGLVIVRKGPA